MANRLCAIVLCLMGLFVLGDRAIATEPAAVLASYVNDDTFAAAYVDLSALRDEGGNILSLFPQSGENARIAQGVEAVINALRAAKVEALYVAAGYGDVHFRGGPIVVFHVGDGGRPEEVARMLAPFAPQVGQWWRDFEVRPQGRDAVLAGSAATLDRYASLVKGERNDLLGPLEKLASDGAVAAVVLRSGPDFRRVVRELWPELPGPLAPVRGELVDRWLHVELAVNRPPDVRPRFALQTTDRDAAELFARLWRDLPAIVTVFGQPGKKRDEAQRYAQLLVDTLSANVEGTRASIELPTDKEQLTKLRTMIGNVTDASMETTRRNRRMGQFKELALAMLNYESANNLLPPAAIRSEDGKPLLSWRVAVLPFLEEGELYKQFRLDEPWDSPHNRKLIEKMPAVFADPDPKLNQLAHEGKTTYQVPVGVETIFHSDEGTTYREILDGTSNTILIVEVEPPRAVVWTKPEDWEADMQTPQRGVARDDREYFTAAFADGHVEVIPVDVDFRKLRGLLTRAGREVFDWP